MALITVKLTCTAQDQNGNPIFNARFDALLDRSDIYVSSVVAPEPIEGYSDSAGVCVLNLWPNTLGSKGSKYRIQAYNPDTDSKFMDTYIVVPNFDCRLEQLILSNPDALITPSAGTFGGSGGDWIGIDTIYKEHRPGDNPDLFIKVGGTKVDSLDGSVYRITGSGSIESKYITPIETGKLLNFHLAYRRYSNSGDPANDGVIGGVHWLNGMKNRISTDQLVIDRTLQVLSGRKEFAVKLGLSGTTGADSYGPSEAKYVVAWVKTFGSDHQTDIEICSVNTLLDTVIPQISAASLSIPSDFKWPVETMPSGLLPAPDYTVAKTFYVTMEGNDSNAGSSLTHPLRTISAALNKVRNQGGGSHVVIVHPGDYTVSPDTEIPPDMALYGYDLRVTKLRLPVGQEENNMFLMNNGIKVRGFSFTGLRHERPLLYSTVSAGKIAHIDKQYFRVGITDMDAVLYQMSGTEAVLASYDYPPEKGFVFVFKQGAFITRSPYIADCSQIHEFSQTQMRLPIDKANGNPLMPRGGGNLRADGSKLDLNSPLRSVVVDSFTAINPNGYGYLVTRNALVQLVSVFTNWSRMGIWAHEGGQITTTNSNTTFGDYSFASTGFRYSVRVTPTYTYKLDMGAAATVRTNIDALVMNLFLFISENWPQTYPDITLAQEDFIKRDTATLLNWLANDLDSGQASGVITFIQGLFDWNGNYVFNASLLGIFNESFVELLSMLLQPTILGSYSVETKNFVTNEIQLVIDNLTTPTKVVFRSVIEANAQQLSYAGNGVNYNSLPYSQRATGTTPSPSSTILKKDGGLVYATFSTEKGDTYLGEDLRVDFNRSTIEGQAFSRGVQNITLPLIVGIGA